MAKRIQLTTDGWKPYLFSEDIAFGGAVDYAVVNKTYAAGFPTVEAKRRYSRAPYVKCSKEVISGAPVKKHIRDRGRVRRWHPEAKPVDG